MDYEDRVKRLKTDLVNTSGSIEKLRLKVQLTRFTHYLDVEESFRLTEELDGEVNRTQDEYTRGWHLYNQGWHDFERGDYLKAVDKFQKSYDYFCLLGELGDALDGKAAALGGMANSYNGYGDFDEALLLTLQAMDFSDKSGDARQAAISSQNIGYIYLSKGKYAPSREFLEQARVYFEESSESYMLLPIYLNIAATHHEEGNYDLCQEWLGRVVMNPTLKKNSHYYCVYHLDLARNLCMQKRYTEAEESVSKGMELADLNGFSARKEQLKFIRGQIFYEIGHHREAEALIRDVKSTRTDNLHLKKLELLSDIAEEQGNFSQALGIQKELFQEYKASHGPDDDLYINPRMKRLEDSHRRLHVISGIGKKITANLNVEQIGMSLKDSLSELMSVDVFSLGLLNEKELTFDVYLEGEERLAVAPIPRESRNSFGIWVVDHHHSLLINDVDREREYYLESHRRTLAKNEEEGKRIRSLIVIPLMIKKSPIGVMIIKSYEPGAYSLTDLNLLESLESFVAVALSNARRASELLKLSEVDFLTGLNNRRLLTKEFVRIAEICRRRESPVSLILLDIDHFKMVNDTYGHDKGDECLRQLSSLLRRSFGRPLDCPGRYGGEEFLIIMGDESKEKGQVLAEKLRVLVESCSYKRMPEDWRMTISLGGYTFYPRRHEELDFDLVAKKADESLYLAKQSGRNKCVWN
jgi:diguanylate cyclase (GGDEF)-like protein